MTTAQAQRNDDAEGPGRFVVPDLHDAAQCHRWVVEAFPEFKTDEQRRSVAEVFAVATGMEVKW